MGKSILFLLLILLITCIWIILPTNPSNAQNGDLSNETNNKELQSANENQDLQIQYSDAVTFKTISRKNTYRIGELISVDYGMLNITNEPISILSIENWTDIKIRDENNGVIGIGGGSPPLYAPRYQLVKIDGYIFSRKFYVIGCQKDGISFQNTTEKFRFENNYFAFEGRGCINIRVPGKYFISVYARNKATSTKNRGVKVVVGKIESVPLEINVIE
jgi:hypothetical protein